MVGELAARHALSKEVVDGVSERTGGVPLFVEEVTRLLLERGESGGLQAIPPTLQQSLAARLDRLRLADPVADHGAFGKLEIENAPIPRAQPGFRSLRPGRGRPIRRLACVLSVPHAEPRVISCGPAASTLGRRAV